MANNIIYHIEDTREHITNNARRSMLFYDTTNNTLGYVKANGTTEMNIITADSSNSITNELGTITFQDSAYISIDAIKALDSDGLSLLNESDVGIIVDGSGDVNLADGKKLITDKVRAIDADGLSLFDDGGTGIFIKDGGSVGIGTTTPIADLDVYKSGSRRIRTFSANAEYDILSDSDTLPVLKVKGTGTADLVNIFNNTTEVFTILDGGNIGIGTTTPTGKLHVEGGTALTGATGAPITLVAQSALDDDANGGDIVLTPGDKHGGGADGIVNITKSLSITGDLAINTSKFTVKSATGNVSGLGSAIFAGNLGSGPLIPQTKLHLSDATVNCIMRFENQDTTISGNEAIGTIEFKSNDASSGAGGIRANMIVKSAAGSPGAEGQTDLLIKLTNRHSATLTTILALTGDGKAGFGIETPTSILDVQGGEATAFFDGETIILHAQDALQSADTAQDGGSIHLTAGDGQTSGVNGIVKVTEGVLEVGTRYKISPQGGTCVYLRNVSGNALTKGMLVESSSTSDDAFTINAEGGDHPIGVVYDTSIGNGYSGWIVVGGIGEVALEDNVAAVHGYWIGASGSEAGYCSTQANSPGFDQEHFDEVGHCIQSVSAGGSGTHIYARTVIHFN